MTQELRVLVAAHYASARLGGEGLVPLLLVDQLRAKGIDTWLVAHESNGDELRERFADQPERLILVPGLPGGYRFFRWGETLPDGPRNIAWAVTQLERQYAMARHIRRIVPELGIDVVHQPIGVAPGVPSPLTKLGAPLVVGPLNGGLSMPPSFAERESTMNRLVQRLRRPVGQVAHQLIRGKLQAAAVLVANERSRAMLPRQAARHSVLLPETGVQLARWTPRDYDRTADDPVRFVFLGRLIPLKGADLLLQSFAGVVRQVQAHLTIVGDGPLRRELEEQADLLGLRDKVTFTGFLDHASAAEQLRTSDVNVFPSLREAGGISVLEAMATALPSIIADWGGPADFIDDSTGIRVSVDSREEFVPRLTAAMTELAQDSARRAAMGKAARDKVAAEYEWSVIVDRLVAVYEQARPH